MGFPRKNLIGEKYNKLEIIELSNKTNHKNTYWVCRCECGNIRTCRSDRLKHNIDKSCKSCLVRNPRKFNGKYNCYEDIHWYLWNRYIKGAKERNLEFNITIEFAWNLYLKQNKKCKLSGVDIVFMQNYCQKWKDSTASLDRIDNTKGYTEDNVQWIHKDLNMMKTDHTQKEFIDWCCLVADNSGRREEDNYQ